MGKEALKINRLPKGEDPSLYDTDRLVPKAEGGNYNSENFTVVRPLEHMERHGILRIRPEHLDQLKAAIDVREQYLKLRIKISNQLLAFNRRTDTEHLGEVEALEKMLGSAEELELMARKNVVREIGLVRKEDALVDAAMNIHGMGPLSVAYLAAYVDLEKAQHASSVWAYVGYDKASNDRYTKNVAGGGNKRLRTALFRAADSMMKTRGAYRDVYDRRKLKTSNSLKIVKSRNTQGKLVEIPWKDTKPSHRHGDAMRVMMKHFLRDYWLVGRKMLGLPISEPYVQAHLGHEHIIPPEARGWPVVE